MTAALAPIGLVALVAALLALRQTLFVILGLALVYAYWVYSPDPARFIILDAWNALNKDVLLSIPLFILAGQIMTRGSMAQRLVRFISALTAPVPGGLAVATIVSCAVFAALSGSSTVTLLAVGSVMYPALIEAGYSRAFAIGALCAAGTLGIIVPPSIPLILYGVMANTSIADLFIAGLGPAALLTLLMALYAFAANIDRGGERWQLKEIIAATTAAGWSLAMPVIILGGIYSGYFTATESAAVACVYALVVELLIHRELDLPGSYDACRETTRLLGSLFPVLMLAVCINVFLTYEHVPPRLVESFTAAVDSDVAFLLATNALLLLVGTFIDIGSAVLLLAPILKPVAVSHGIDPIHFGIVMIVNLEIGYLTPPLGLNLIVAMSAFGVKFWDVCKAVVPFLVLMLIGLAMVTYVPALSLVLIG